MLYDSLADRWFVTQFNLSFDARTEWPCTSPFQRPAIRPEHISLMSLTNPGRFVDYPHFGVWPDGYYMSSNDFTPPGVSPFLGAGFYTFERAKMLSAILQQRS